MLRNGAYSDDQLVTKKCRIEFIRGRIDGPFWCCKVSPMDMLNTERTKNQVEVDYNPSIKYLVDRMSWRWSDTSSFLSQSRRYWSAFRGRRWLPNMISALNAFALTTCSPIYLQSPSHQATYKPLWRDWTSSKSITTKVQANETLSEHTNNDGLAHRSGNARSSQEWINRKKQSQGGQYADNEKALIRTRDAAWRKWKRLMKMIRCDDIRNVITYNIW